MDFIMNPKNLKDLLLLSDNELEEIYESKMDIESISIKEKIKRKGKGKKK